MEETHSLTRVGVGGIPRIFSGVRGAGKHHCLCCPSTLVAQMGAEARRSSPPTASVSFKLTSAQTSSSHILKVPPNPCLLKRHVAPAWHTPDLHHFSPPTSVFPARMLPAENTQGPLAGTQYSSGQPAKATHRQAYTVCAGKFLHDVYSFKTRR